MCDCFYLHYYILERFGTGFSNHSSGIKMFIITTLVKTNLFQKFEIYDNF